MIVSFTHSILVGCLAGFVSGLLGTSSGGILVPALTLLLNLEQHMAQMISLAAQILPTALPGLMIYKKKGNVIPWKIILFISLFFMLGGALGARYATSLTAKTLSWFFIVYLLLLALIMIKKKSSLEPKIESSKISFRTIPIYKFIILGIIAGFSSGILGVGGGLAITALSIGLIHFNQHQAQSISLAVSVLPLTLPAVCVYVYSGKSLPWEMLFYIVLGLLLGTSLGAYCANKIPAKKLQISFIFIVVTMAIGMASKLILHN